MPWIKCLGGGGGKARRGKPLSVSQPIHLLVKSDFEPQCHVFRTKQLRKPRPCHLCHQAVIKQASCCRVCKYICHKTCEDKSQKDAVNVDYFIVEGNVRNQGGPSWKLYDEVVPPERCSPVVICEVFSSCESIFWFCFRVLERIFLLASRRARDGKIAKCDYTKCT